MGILPLSFSFSSARFNGASRLSIDTLNFTVYIFTYIYIRYIRMGKSDGNISTCVFIPDEPVLYI